MNESFSTCLLLSFMIRCPFISSKGQLLHRHLKAKSLLPLKLLVILLGNNLFYIPFFQLDLSYQLTSPQMNFSRVKLWNENTHEYYKLRKW